MTPKQSFVLGCIFASIGWDLLTHGNIDLKRLAKRVFYVTVSCYVAMEIILDK